MLRSLMISNLSQEINNYSKRYLHKKSECSDHDHPNSLIGLIHNKIQIFLRLRNNDRYKSLCKIYKKIRMSHLLVKFRFKF